MSDIREDSAKVEQIKKELEKEGMDKVQTMWKTNSVNEKTITDVLKSGMKTFEEKTGHPMSYSDMRELYG